MTLDEPLIDLKIENILISKTGNIKIIDFGLSNLFSPHSHLSTFCGSLYFAAPELLNAKVYTGPEVDVWSFGIVLYVLVCGKVPFDDQSMPALHAKIKRGHVEYPAWLSGECKHILSRMLVTDPSKRATLPEILSHSWMTKGYEGAPNAHLPERKPLRAGELDPEVIKGMTGFEFGTPEEIELRLTEVLTSEIYGAVLSAWDAKHSPNASSNQLNDSTALGRATTRGSQDSRSRTGSKRFSGIDFYRKKISVFGNRDESGSSGTLNGSGLNGTLVPTWPGAGKEPLDPTRGFHPLISIYYLVSEKMDRERLYGHSFFASSDASLLTSQAGSAHAQGARPASMVAGGTTSMPTPADIPQDAVRMPEASHVSAYKGPDAAAKDLAAPPRTLAPVAPSPTPVFESREKSKPLPNMAGPPRARANGDEVEAALREKGIVPAGAWNPAGTAALPPSAAGAQAMPIGNNHKRSMSMSTRKPRTSSGLPTDDASAQSPTDASTAGTMRSMRKTGSPENRRSMHVTTGSVSVAGPPDGATPGTPSSLLRRFGSLLSRSPSMSVDPEPREKRKGSRMSTGGIPPSSSGRRMTVALTPGGVDESAERLNALSLAEAEENPVSADDDLREMTPAPHSAPAEGVTVKRSGTVQGLSTPAKESSTGSPHRREATLPSHASVGRAMGAQMSPTGRRRPLTGRSTATGTESPQQMAASPSPSPAKAALPLTDNDGWQGPTPSEAQANLLSSSTKNSSGRTPQPGTALTTKPVFLKGLFSVQTTSTKPRALITADLVRVLDRIGVQYREIRGGYECVHLPSIDFSRGNAGTPGQGNARIPIEQQGAQGEAADYVGAGEAEVIRPQAPRRKQSRISVLSSLREKRRESSQTDRSPRQSPEVPTRSRASSLMLGNGSHEDVSSSVAAAGENGVTPSRSGGRLHRQRTDSLGAPSFFGGASSSGGQVGASNSPTKLQSQGLPDAASATSAPAVPSKLNGVAHSGDNAGAVPGAVPADLIVRFEIFVVKVPLLLGVNGLQFRRVSGNPWQYQMLAKRVLQELKL